MAEQRGEPDALSSILDLEKRPNVHLGSDDLLGSEKLKMKTGLFDKHGTEISAGDRVSLAGNMTADNSMGYLPNGWFFDEEDVYEVYFDERIQNWSLRLDCEPDSPLNIKYMNHAVGLLHDGSAEIVSPNQ